MGDSMWKCEPSDGFQFQMTLTTNLKFSQTNNYNSYSSRLKDRMYTSKLEIKTATGENIIWYSNTSVPGPKFREKPVPFKWALQVTYWYRDELPEYWDELPGFTRWNPPESVCFAPFGHMSTARTTDKDNYYTLS